MSSFASPCSRGLEDLATNEMQRNKEKNKIIRQTVRQCDSFAEISDAKLLSSYLYQCAFLVQVFYVCSGNDSKSEGSLIKTILPRSIASDYWKPEEIPWGCQSGMNLVKSWEDMLVFIAACVGAM